MPAADRGEFGQPGSAPLMNWHEVPLVFDCEGSRLMGIITRPERPHYTAVVIVVGGPQYRAGSHRQFTLLARQLAEQGIASIRFDYRGMGDSEGDMRNFENIDLDIRTAINNLMTHVPQIKQVALWGLCDAASAALYYGHTDPRVTGLFLLNPWVHTEAGAARARIKHYYLARLLSKAFWAKLLTGKVKMGASFAELADSAQKAKETNTGTAAATLDPRHGSPGYIDRMRKGMQKYTGKMMIVLSGNDLTAQEFGAMMQNDRSWRVASKNHKIKTIKIKAANHTFAAKIWRAQVEGHTAGWICPEITQK